MKEINEIKKKIPVNPAYGYDKEELESRLAELYYIPLEVQDGLYEHPNGRIERVIGHDPITKETIIDHVRSRGRELKAPTFFMRANMMDWDIATHLLTVGYRRHDLILADVLLELANLKNAMFNNLTDNIFSASLLDLEDIEIIRGWYNGREVCC